ncbi:uncharacterized protein LOC125673215 [Ostrea edulis]|uniref:uncharacterized protein LOC125673215 n=1 Tax=Ostrea edulis TaxID=37623 RepID=UPI0024AFBB40|nr:uncharacterized protein LOC125673215 [Ostrea edulis]
MLTPPSYLIQPLAYPVPKHRRYFQFPWPESASSKKVKVEIFQDPSNISRKDTKLSTTVQNPGAQMKSSEHSFPFNDLVILCNRKVTTCKKVLMDFKNRYSVSNELQWVSNAQDVRDVKKGVLVCLKISRLTDDITDAIKMVDLSDAETIFLVIIHTVEPGIEVDTSFLSRDSRIDVAHIVYSENCGCYDCPENKSAISKLSSWFKS